MTLATRRMSNNAENDQRRAVGRPTFNYLDSPFIRICVLRAKWAVKKTNSISEVLGASLMCVCVGGCVCVGVCMCATTSSCSDGQLNDACEQGEGGRER